MKDAVTRKEDAQPERLVRVAVIYDATEILLQKRSLSKRHFPGLWTESATGHIETDESADEAARRELQEETSLSLNLTSIGVDVLPTPEVVQENHLFVAETSIRVRPTVEVGEGSGFKWVKIDELVSDLRAHPESYTPGLKKYLVRYVDSITSRP